MYPWGVSLLPPAQRPLRTSPPWLWARLCNPAPPPLRQHIPAEAALPLFRPKPSNMLLIRWVHNSDHQGSKSPQEQKKRLSGQGCS